jgi:uracil-DNA glycosylase
MADIKQTGDDPRPQIAACRICADRFAATATGHAPRPVVWFRRRPPILIASQAPGARVHAEGRAFWDRSGDRLRDWMGLDRAAFYDEDLVSVLPTAFCFPGYDANGSDLPPPPVCWDTWHARALAFIGKPALTLVIGTYAMRRHLGERGPMTDVVRAWRTRAPEVFVLPHPSWRNTAWLNRHSWFAEQVLPALRTRVVQVRGLRK